MPNVLYGLHEESVGWSKCQVRCMESVACDVFVVDGNQIMQKH